MNDNDVRLLTEIDARSKSNGYRIDNIEEEIKEIKTENKAIYSLVESVKTISESVSDMKTDIKEIKKSQGDLSVKISEVESKPAKETADIVTKVKVAVITAISTSLALGILGSLIYFVK